MKVKFNVLYFGGSESYRPDKLRVMSGKRYKKGVVYDLSDEEYKQAVKDGASFKVVSGDVPVESDDAAGTLRDFDAERAASDAMVAANEEAVETVKKRGPGRPRKNS